VPSSQEPAALDRARRHAAELPGFSHRVLEAAHDAMVTAPRELAALLLEAADQPLDLRGSVSA
jgi:citrate synthase